jgi:hypothetical protein
LLEPRHRVRGQEDANHTLHMFISFFFVFKERET